MIYDYYSLLGYTRYSMSKYGVPQPYHNPLEFINQAYVDCKETDELSLKKFIKSVIIHTSARISQNTLMGEWHKVCNCCLEEKSSRMFRVRFKHGGLDEIHWYKSPNCMLCEKINAKSYYDSIKHDEDFKFKNIIRAKKYSEANKDMVNAKQKIKRSKPSYKKNRKEYNERNKEKIRLQHRLFQAKQREDLTDGYIKGLLRSKLPKEDITAEIILSKRQEILKQRNSIDTVDIFDGAFSKALKKGRWKQKK